MEILLWIVIAFLFSWLIISVWYRRKVSEREKSLERFILSDENLRQMLLNQDNSADNE